MTIVDDVTGWPICVGCTDAYVAFSDDGSGLCGSCARKAKDAELVRLRGALEGIEFAVSRLLPDDAVMLVGRPTFDSPEERAAYEGMHFLQRMRWLTEHGRVVVFRGFKQGDAT